MEARVESIGASVLLSCEFYDVPAVFGDGRTKLVLTGPIVGHSRINTVCSCQQYPCRAGDSDQEEDDSKESTKSVRSLLRHPTRTDDPIDSKRTNRDIERAWCAIRLQLPNDCLRIVTLRPVSVP